MTIQYYFDLIKPGIVLGNIISAISGFLLATHHEHHINYIILMYMILGTTLVIASSCVLNNIIDRDIDAIMDRTKNRVLAKNINSCFVKNSIIYAIILNTLGFLFLGLTKNLLTILLTIIGFLVYIGIYSLWMKRKSIYSTIIGSISGSMPPIIGYCTVSHTLDTGAWLLFIAFSFWQIPHSYSITIFRSQDYKKASIPTFNIKKGIKSTRIHMILCILIFTLANISLTVLGYTSYTFLYIISIMNIFWLYTGWYIYKQLDNDLKWAKKMFILSIVIITSLNVLLSLDSIFIFY